MNVSKGLMKRLCHLCPPVITLEYDKYFRFMWRRKALQTSVWDSQSPWN